MIGSEVRQPEDAPPIRVKKYEIVDELNVLDNKIWKRIHSKEVRQQFKRVKHLVNDLRVRGVS